MIKEIMFMYVECFKNNGIDYLRLVQSNRVTNSKGVKTARKKVVYNIGPLSKFDDGKPDYIERLKKSFKAGNPIISSLEKYCNTENLPVFINLLSLKIVQIALEILKFFLIFC